MDIQCLFFNLAAYIQRFLWILWILMILWTVQDEIPEVLAIVNWQTSFLNCSTILVVCFVVPLLWWTGPYPCLWMSEPLGMLLYSTHSWRSPINLFTCGILQIGVFRALINFLLMSRPSPFGMCCRHLCRILNEKWKRICKLLCHFYLCFPQRPTSVELGFVINVIW